MTGFGGAVKLTGESEYRKALSQITQNLRELSSEMNVVASAYDKNDNSISTLKSKQEALNQVLEKQKSVLTNATNAYNSFKSKLDEQAKAHNDLVKKYDEEKNKLEEIKRTQGESSDAYKKQLSVVEDLAKAVESSSRNYDENEKSLSKLKTQMNNAQTEVNKTASEIKNLDSKMENAEKATDELGNEIDETGKKAKNASNDGISALTYALGDLLASGIKKVASAITEQLDTAIARVDILSSYQNTMENLGYSTEEVAEAQEKLKEGILGLPTTLPSIVQLQQQYGALLGDLGEATDLTLALNDATLAGGQGQEIANSALDQWYQIIANGKPDLQSWRIINGAMPAQMNQIAEAVMGAGEQSMDLFEAWKEGTVTTQEVIDAVIALDKEGGNSFASFEEQAHTASGGIQTSMTNIKTAIATSLANVIEEIGQENIVNALDDIKQKIKDFGAVAVEVVGWLIDNAPTIEAVIVGITGALTTLFFVGGGFNILKDAVIAWTSASKLAAAAQWLLNAAMNANPIGLILTAVVGLAGAFVVLWKKSDKFREFWIKTWEKAKEVFDVVWDAIIKFFTETIPEALESFKEFWIGVWESVSTFFTDVWDSIIGFFTETIPNAFNSVLETIQGWINTVVEWFQSLPAKIGEVVDNIVQWFKELPYNLGFAIGEMLGHLIQFGQDAKEWVTTKIPEIIDNIVTFFSELPSKIWEWLTNTFNKIVEWGKEVKDKAVEIGKEFIDNVIKFFKELPGKIWSWLTETFNKIKTWASETISKAIETGKTFVNNVINYVKELPGKIWSWLSNALSKVGQFAIDMARKAKEGAINTFNNIINKLKEIPEKVKNIGKQIVEGLWNGIKNAGNWIKEKVGQFASGILDGMKSVLGIHSPSTLFRDQVGKNIALGLGEGFTDEMANVSREMQDAIPTSFDVDSTVNGARYASSTSSYGNMVDAFKQALSEMKIELDDEVAGKFIDKTVTRLVYD